MNTYIYIYIERERDINHTYDNTYYYKYDDYNQRHRAE